MPKIEILGSNISIIASYADAYNYIEGMIKSKGQPRYITVNNVHTVMIGVKDKNYRAIINNATLALPDGRPLSVIGRINGHKISRIFGPTFMENVIDWGRKDGLKHYFFGSTPDTLDKLNKAVQLKYPGALIAGSYSPPFGRFTEEENRKFLAAIKNAGADIIWIGLGAPKQELWMFENYKNLDSGVMVGIGAGFDYIAGNLKHAPGWMKNMSLEWLYRLIQEPRRLWKRYLVTNTLFIILITAQFLGLKKRD